MLASRRTTYLLSTNVSPDPSTPLAFTRSMMDPETLHSSSLTIITTTILTAILWHIVVRHIFFSPLRRIPAARADWQTRAFKWAWIEPTPLQLLEWANKTQNQGLLRYYGIGGATRILLTSPDAVKEVMVTKRYDAYARPASGTQTIELLFGHGLLTSEGDTHRKQKRALAPAFTHRIISGLYPVFWSKACELVKRIGSEIEAASLNKHCTDIKLLEWASRAGLDIIGVAVWGQDFNALAQPHSEFVCKYERIFRPGTAKSRQQAKWIYAASHLVPMGWLSRRFPCEFFREKAAGERAIRQACSAAVDARHAALRDGETSSKDVLSRMMELDTFDDKALQGQMMNFLSAGHGTTSLTVTWLCYFLAQNPAVLSRLREDIRSTLPSPFRTGGPPVTAETFTSLPYLQDTIRETLRVMPVIPILRREATKRTSILGHAIPAGTSVVCAPWVSNMLEEEWGADAHTFNPDRWSRARQHPQRAVPPTSAYSYIPFSCGPRTCIGESFAKAEISALVAALVGTFEFELVADKKPLDIIWGVSATPLGLHLRMRQLEGW